MTCNVHVTHLFYFYLQTLYDSLMNIDYIIREVWMSQYIFDYILKYWERNLATKQEILGPEKLIYLFILQYVIK